MQIALNIFILFLLYILYVRDPSHLNAYLGCYMQSISKTLSEIIDAAATANIIENIQHQKILPIRFYAQRKHETNVLSVKTIDEGADGKIVLVFL